MKLPKVILLYEMCVLHIAKKCEGGVRMTYIKPMVTSYDFKDFESIEAGCCTCKCVCECECKCVSQTI